LLVQHQGSEANDGAQHNNFLNIRSKFLTHVSPRRQAFDPGSAPGISSLEPQNEALAEFHARTDTTFTAQSYLETFLYARENLLAIANHDLYGVPCFWEALDGENDQ
jgi:hypothetical protein